MNLFSPVPPFFFSFFLSFVLTLFVLPPPPISSRVTLLAPLPSLTCFGASPRPTFFVSTFAFVEDPIGSLSKDVWSPFYPPREGLLKVRDRLRGALMEYDPDYDSKSSGVVFVSRDKDNTVRSISNEEELIGESRRVGEREQVCVCV